MASKECASSSVFGESFTNSSNCNSSSSSSGPSLSHVPEFPADMKIKSFTDERIAPEDAVEVLVKLGFSREPSVRAVYNNMELSNAYDSLCKALRQEYDNNSGSVVTPLWKSPITVHIGECCMYHPHECVVLTLSLLDCFKSVLYNYIH